MQNKKKRKKLSDMLKAIPELNNRVYYKPPSDHKMTYPCVMYEFSNILDDKADNIRYIQRDEYTITVIDPNPDSPIPDKVLNLPYCRLDRPYKADGLYHWVFTIYV